MVPVLQQSKAWLAAICLLCVASMFAGCDGPEPSAGSGEAAAKKKLPKLDLHRPDSLAAAMSRIEELHGGMTQGDGWPEPLKLRVIETIHGTGASGHSHYHLAKSEDDEEGFKHDDHDDVVKMEEEVVVHDVSIDALEEVYDLFRWLPSIAAETDLEKAKWQQLKKLTEAEADRLSEIRGKESPETQRTGYRAAAADVEKCLTALKELMPESGE